MKRVTKITGPEATYEAVKKARYGRQDWISYTEKNGSKVAELLSAESLKRAMIAVGLKGMFFHIGPGGDKSLVEWPLATFMHYNLKYNTLNGGKGTRVYLNK